MTRCQRRFVRCGATDDDAFYHASALRQSSSDTCLACQAVTSAILGLRRLG